MPNEAIEHTQPIMLTENYRWEGWDVFRDLITEDLKRLNNGAIGAKTEMEKRDFDSWNTDGKFVPLPYPYGMPETTYVYNHTFHARCSSVGFKQLREAGIKIVTDNVHVKKCSSHSKKSHDLLEPFFNDDYGLQMLYRE